MSAGARSSESGASRLGRGRRSRCGRVNVLGEDKVGGVVPEGLQHKRSDGNERGPKLRCKDDVGDAGVGKCRGEQVVERARGGSPPRAARA